MTTTYLGLDKKGGGKGVYEARGGAERNRRGSRYASSDRDYRNIWRTYFYPLTLVTLVDVLQYLFFLEEFTFFFPLLVVSSLQGHCE